jgi:hypothetical protein
MSMKKKRTLYECAHARVRNERICCDKEYPLSQTSVDGNLDIQH